VSTPPGSQDVVADDDLAALFGGDESSDAEDYDPSAAPQGSGSDAGGGDSGDDTDPGEVRRAHAAPDPAEMHYRAHFSDQQGVGYAVACRVSLAHAWRIVTPSQCLGLVHCVR